MYEERQSQSQLQLTDFFFTTNMKTTPTLYTIFAFNLKKIKVTPSLFSIYMINLYDLILLAYLP